MSGAIDQEKKEKGWKWYKEWKGAWVTQTWNRKAN